jgi:hypothetical protein
MQVLKRAPDSLNVISEQTYSAVAVLTESAANVDPVPRARGREQPPIASRSTSRTRHWLA